MAGWKPDDENEEAVLDQVEEKVDKPKRYKVLLHNDDYTSMEFVISVLKEVFNKSLHDAATIMLAVHNQGVGIAGVFTYEVAEAKANKVIRLARAQDFPLLCTTEEE